MTREAYLTLKNGIKTSAYLEIRFCMTKQSEVFVQIYGRFFLILLFVMGAKGTLLDIFYFFQCVFIL